ISVAAARTLAGRFAAAFGTRIETSFAALTTLFPPPATIAALKPSQVAKCGIVGARARSIVALARAIADRKLALAPGSDVEQTIAALCTLPGIGEWTAQYIAMRALGWPDAFPHTDFGVMKALGETDPKRVLAAAET